MSRGRLLASVLCFALACSGTKTMDREQLASERRQLHSLDDEALLFDRVMLLRRTTRTFAHAHAVYLHRASREIAERLARARPAPGAEDEFQRVTADAIRLEERFVALLLRFQ
jgi:hypothetical protein